MTGLGERAAVAGVAQAQREFHQWYYDAGVWRRLLYRGVHVCKWVGDLWNYQEIIEERRPSLIVELGAAAGGSTLFFADALSRARPGGDWRVLSVDIDVSANQAEGRKGVEVACASSTSPGVAARIASLRNEYPGPMFVILDSDHRMGHVLAELEMLRPLTRRDDYVVVEDGNVNGNPVLPDFGPGPREAVLEYEVRHAGDYDHDSMRESKFGFTFAPYGYLVRR